MKTLPSLTNAMMGKKNFGYYVRTDKNSQCCDFIISKMNGDNLTLLLIDTTLRNKVNGKINNFYQKFLTGNASFQSMIA
jgi:hypothetical protein